MYRILLILLLALFSSVLALSDVNKQCILDNDEVWSNDNLIGVWYKMFKFTLFGGMVPSSYCPTINFTRPSAEIVQEYKDRYNDPDLPYNIDDNPIMIDEGYDKVGLLIGHTVAKFYILTPKPIGIVLHDGYNVDVYRPLTPHYVIYMECSMRGNILHLMSNNRYAPIVEMEELIKNTPQLARLEKQRYCATY